MKTATNSKTKTSIQVISLYDLIANNQFNIFVTLYYIIISVFNYNSIVYLDYLLNYTPEHRDLFEEIQINLEFCQVLNLFTMLILYIISDLIDKHYYTKNQLKAITLLISDILKLTTIAYQYFHYNGGRINEKDKTALFSTIEATYIIKIVCILLVVIVILTNHTCIYLDKAINYLEKWSKSYKITYINTNNISSNIKAKEDV